MFMLCGGGGFIEATSSTGSKGVMGLYQIPAGAKVKVEVKFRDGHYRDMHQEIEVYNLNQKVDWAYLEPSHEQYFAGTFAFAIINGYKTFSPETLEFISKGWVHIHGWNMPASSSDWLSDSAPGVDIDYLKVSYEIL